MLSENPFLLIVMVLVLGTIFVNGATDAANAIAEAVGTRSIGIDAAIIMSVFCNFIGLVAMILEKIPVTSSRYVGQRSQMARITTLLWVYVSR